MAKAKKTETTVTATAEMDTVPVVVEKSTKSTKSSKTSQKSVKEPKTAKSGKTEVVDVVLTKVEDVATGTATATTTTGAVGAVEAVDVVDSVMVDGFSEFLAKLQTITSQMGSLKTEFRTLEKRAVRELKAAQKQASKRKRKSVNRAPSGFIKPTLISKELATFLNKPIGTEMARTEVTREINGYIREHNLQDKSNGRKINPDKNLASLLKIGDGDELTYFNLQRYMSPHFAKSQPKVDGVASGAVTA